MSEGERNWVVVGAGGMATNIVDTFNLQRQGYISHYFDEPKHEGEEKYGVPVKMEAPPDYYYFSVIGKTREKRALLNRLEDMLPSPEYVYIKHYDTHIAKTVEHGYGCVIQPMTNIYSRVKIGEHVLICGGSRIGHDTKIGDYCTLSPEVAIGGNCIIKDGVFLGLNCTIRDGIRIGKGATIGCGAVVVNDVPENWVVGGNPARHIKGNDPW